MIKNQYGIWERRTAICSVGGCGKNVKALGMCSRHYEQTRLHGETHDRPSGVAPLPAHERVLSHVEPDGECWVYVAAPNTKRPTVLQQGRCVTIYVAVYEALVGPVPKGLNLHHTCKNPKCVNPAHLELMSRADHTRLHRPRLGTGRSAR